MVNSINDLIYKYLTPYRRSGSDEIRARTCPFCNGGDSGDEYTFSLNIDTGSYCCFRGSCAASGGIEQLAAHFGETYRGRNSRMNTKSSIQYKFPRTELMSLTDPIVAYFEKRHISKETLEFYGVSSDKNGNIVFPFTWNGDLIYVKYRKPVKPSKNEPKEWQESDTRPILFGMDLCDTSLPLVITEGEIDALSLREAGVTNVVSVPCGCENLKWVEECWDWLEDFNSITIFGDNDAPGRRMVSQLTKRLGESRCKIIEEYPLKPDGSECKDANEILYYLGDLALLDVLDSAKEIPTRGLVSLSKVVPVDPTTIPRIKTNIPDLDSSIGGLREGAVTVFTGRAGEGKSTLSGLLLLNAIEQGHNVCAYSGELTSEEFQQWINLQAAGSDYITTKYDPVKGQQVPVIPKNIEQAIMNWYDGHFFLYDNQEIFESNQSESIIEVFTTAVRKYGCDLFLVDNLMTALSDSDEETKAQGRFVNALKRFANRFKVHVIIVAHPRKTQKGESIRQDDIGGNSATVRLAHSAIVVEKPNLRVIKARDAGHLKLIECCYCPDSRRIYQKDKGDMNKFSWNDGSYEQPKKKACDLPEYAVQVGQPEGMF